MARAIEKGATYIDKLCHKFYDEQKGHGKKSDYVCRICGGPLETYYCEDRLYLVRCADCGTLALVKAANPGDAARVTLARPTLTPPNEPLSLEELREMDGEPVYIVSDKFRIAEWNVLNGIGEIVLSYDQPYIGMKCVARAIKFINGREFRIDTYGDDWLAYRRPPEGEEDT